MNLSHTTGRYANDTIRRYRSSLFSPSIDGIAHTSTQTMHTRQSRNISTRGANNGAQNANQILEDEAPNYEIIRIARMEFSSAQVYKHVTCSTLASQGLSRERPPLPSNASDDRESPSGVVLDNRSAVRGNTVCANERIVQPSTLGATRRAAHSAGAPTANNAVVGATATASTELANHQQLAFELQCASCHCSVALSVREACVAPSDIHVDVGTRIVIGQGRGQSSLPFARAGTHGQAGEQALQQLPQPVHVVLQNNRCTAADRIELENILARTHSPQCELLQHFWQGVLIQYSYVSLYITYLLQG